MTVFQVLGGANAVFRKLTIEGGLAQDNGTGGALPGTTESRGGGLLVQDGAHVNFFDVSLDGNRAIGGSGRAGTAGAAPNGGPGEAAAGGGLFLSAGTVGLTDSKVTANVATGGTGGGGSSQSFTRTAITTVCVGQGGRGGAGGAGAGGGLYLLSGSIGLVRSTVSGNSAIGANGGGGGLVCATGARENLIPGGSGAAARGAGLFIAAGALRLVQSSVSANSGVGGSGGPGGLGDGASGGSSRGAGVFAASGNVSLANTTVFANKVSGGPGGETHGTLRRSPGGDRRRRSLCERRQHLAERRYPRFQSKAPASSVESSTPAGLSSGGGIANAGAITLVINTTLIGNNTQDSGNPSNGDDVSGPITSSHSLISQSAGAVITDNGGNILDVDPLLDPRGLRFNGGPTQTVALETRSPADGTGDNAICAAPSPTGLGKMDQRGFPASAAATNSADIPAPAITNLLVLPTFEWFGFEPVGKQTPFRNPSVTNNQAVSVALGARIGGANPADFIEHDTCGASLARNATCHISIAFHPSATGRRSAVLTVSDRPDRTSPYQIILVGVGK